MLTYTSILQVIASAPYHHHHTRSQFQEPLVTRSTHCTIWMEVVTFDYCMLIGVSVLVDVQCHIAVYQTINEVQNYSSI